MSMSSEEHYGLMSIHEEEQGQEALLVEIEMSQSIDEEEKEESPSDEANKKLRTQRFPFARNKRRNRQVSSEKFMNDKEMMRMVMLLPTENTENGCNVHVAREMLDSALSEANTDTILREEMIISALQNVSNERDLALEQNARWLLEKADKKRNNRGAKRKKNASRRNERVSSIAIFRPGSLLRRKEKVYKPLSSSAVDNDAEWRSAVDPKTRRTYYYNRVSRIPTWTAPQDFFAPNGHTSKNPPVWIMDVDRKNGNVFYTNSETKQRTSELPKHLDDSMSLMEEDDLSEITGQ